MKNLLRPSLVLALHNLLSLKLASDYSIKPLPWPLVPDFSLYKYLYAKFRHWIVSSELYCPTSFARALITSPTINALSSKYCNEDNKTYPGAPCSCPSELNPRPMALFRGFLQFRVDLMFIKDYYVNFIIHLFCWLWFVLSTFSF